MILHFILTSFVAYMAWTLACLETNARTARKMGIPTVRIPFDVNNNIWVLFQPLLWRVLAQFPVEWAMYPDFVRFSHRNWHFLEKSSPITRFGHVWALVSPGGVHLHVSDPESIQNILLRLRDFYRPIHKYRKSLLKAQSARVGTLDTTRIEQLLTNRVEMLNLFGNNVFTVGINDWLRHRKAVARPLHEVTKSFIWHESLRQTRGMVQLWASDTDAGTTQMLEDLRNLTLNVLVAAAYGKQSEFTRFDDTEHKDTAEFRGALSVVQRNAIAAMVAPKWLLHGPLAPRRLAEVGHAAKRLRKHITETIREEKERYLVGKPASTGLISSLVRASSHLVAEEAREDKAEYPDDTENTHGLSTDEILGNTFVIDFAGYDTTASTLSFTLMLLAANPHVQDWAAEEVGIVCQGKDSEDWGDDVFNNLKRCQALFLETLRVYPPVTGIPKIAIRETQTLRIADKVVAIPPGTETFPLLLGVQTDPTHWRKPLERDPPRWIVRQESASGTCVEDLLVPKRGTFFPWSDGPQGCVGKRFAQVEGAAMLAVLLQRHRIRAKPAPGQTEAQARKAARECADDVNYQLLLKMNRAEKVELGCFKVAI